MWNSLDAKNVQVIEVVGDKEIGGYKASTSGSPWIALPFNSPKK